MRRRYLLTTLAAAIVLLVLDLAWLGAVAAAHYAELLGPLKRPEPAWLPVVLFYCMYVGYIVGWCVRSASSVANGAVRGAAMGFLVYATYEWVNWALIAEWPVALVPVDVAWGVFLTAATAAAGRWVWQKVPTNSD